MVRAGFAAALLMLLLSVGTSALGAVTFVYPAPDSWVKRSDYLILKLNNNEITGARLAINGTASDVLEVGVPEYRRIFQDILIVQPAWDQGRNEVLVELYKGKEKVETASTTVFFVPSGDPAKAPPEFKANLVHVEKTEKLCVDCHVMNPSPSQASSTSEKENPCYGCHKKLLNVKFVHGPAGTYSCSYCHKGSAAAGKYAVTKRDAALCNDCHEDKATEYKKKKYLHGPILAGMCEVCHDSHGSPHYAQLKLPINELCLSCHDSINKSYHVVRTTTGGGHPLSGKKDPSSPSGREMSCISCHNPHSGDVRFFFRNNAEERTLLCQMCHNK